MNVTIIGAGNSGLAMAAHLSYLGETVTLWNRTKTSIQELSVTKTIKIEGYLNEQVHVSHVTDDISLALKDADIVFVTTPANAHKELSELIAKNIDRELLIVLNPGRTFGAIEFKYIFGQYNKRLSPMIAEAQTIIYTCRRSGIDSVNIIALKSGVLISAINPQDNLRLISMLPKGIRKYFIPATTMIETSIGNVGMILHCAPLLFNIGWTESKTNSYKYYYDGITPTVANFLEKLDKERVLVSEALNHKVESLEEWLKRTYHVDGNGLYECLQNNEAYRTIEAPKTLIHRYMNEDIPCGLVPLEAIGLRLQLDMSCTTLIIDLATKIIGIDYRQNGRNLENAFRNRELSLDLEELWKTLGAGDLVSKQ